MRGFFDWLMDRWRPWTPNCIPDDLALPEIEWSAFHAEDMRRDADSSWERGVFKLLGLEEARRANWAWHPSVLLAMEEVSLAFYLVEQQRQIAEIVSRQNIDRLTAALAGYFRRSGRPRDEQDIRHQIDAWLATYSAPDAQTVSLISRKVSIRLPLWHQLLTVDEEVRRTIRGKYGPKDLGHVGLAVRTVLDGAARYDYLTPLNGRVFATTGVDGVHFSLLVENDAITEDSLVVMTIPSCGRNLIVGESLRDFLCLGIRRGFDRLDLLDSDQKEEAVRAFVGDNDVSVDFAVGEVERTILRLLEERLQLEPWTDPERFDALQVRHAGRLKLPPDAERRERG